MDRKKELFEAKQAANEALTRISHALSSLDSASSWGFWDVLGGGLISGLMKRSRIEDANRDMMLVSDALKRLNAELEDVQISLPQEVSNSISDQVFDLMFDNIFTDVRVQGEIKQSLTELKDLRYSILEIVKRIDRDLNSIK